MIKIIFARPSVKHLPLNTFWLSLLILVFFDNWLTDIRNAAFKSLIQTLIEPLNCTWLPSCSIKTKADLADKTVWINGLKNQAEHSASKLLEVYFKKWLYPYNHFFCFELPKQFWTLFLCKLNPLDHFFKTKDFGGNHGPNGNAFSQRRKDFPFYLIPISASYKP